MEEETKTPGKKFKTFAEVYDYDTSMELKFEPDYDIPIFDFCDI